MVPFYSDYLPARPTIDVLDECKLINVRQTPFDNLLNAAVKRGLDIIGSLILIILTSPVMLVTAIGVKLSSPGPVIFRQERIGLNKKPFMMYKFRSMRVNVQQETGWSTDCDPRKTHFGSFIRKFSLDELPQFFNVLKGDMSLVGPRPEVPYHVEHFKEEIPRYLVRQQVRPGCTGWGADPRPARRYRHCRAHPLRHLVHRKLDRGAGHQDHLPHRVRRQDGQRRKTTITPCALPDGSVCNEQKGAQGRHRSRLACRYAGGTALWTP